jgi:trans-aconitate methyltransferase
VKDRHYTQPLVHPAPETSGCHSLLLSRRFWSGPLDEAARHLKLGRVPHTSPVLRCVGFACVPEASSDPIAFPVIKLYAAIIKSMSTAQTWDPASYARNARFVSDLGSPVVDLLAPKPGERILDLGCGDGVLTKKLVDLGCEVVAVDSSLPQIEAARKLGLNAFAISAEDLQYKEEFDAVFSNAVLHWIKRADVVLAGVYRSLKPGGRFVAECGGHGCVHKIRTALVQALDRRGFDGEARVPWYFPTPGDYATRLERAGFRVDSIALIPRPTPLPGDIIDYLETFALSFFQGFTDEARIDYLQEVRTALEPQLRDPNGIWVADYLRLRFAATKTRD